MFGSLKAKLQYTAGFGVDNWRMDGRTGEGLPGWYFLMDPSKSFGCIPYNLIIAKMLMFSTLMIWN